MLFTGIEYNYFPTTATSRLLVGNEDDLKPLIERYGNEIDTWDVDREMEEIL